MYKLIYDRKQNPTDFLVEEEGEIRTFVLISNILNFIVWFITIGQAKKAIFRIAPVYERSLHPSRMNKIKNSDYLFYLELSIPKK